jgi:hypothetical protein
VDAVAPLCEDPNKLPNDFMEFKKRGEETMSSPGSVKYPSVVL